MREKTRRLLEAAFRRAYLKLPEETKDELRRQAEFMSTPEYNSWWSATKAAMDGDEAPLRRWAYERTGVKRLV